MAFLDDLAERLGAARQGRGLVVIERDRPIVIKVGSELSISADVPELGEAAMTARIGDLGLVPDARTGDPPFDAAWTITTPTPELAPLLLTRAVQRALDATRVPGGLVETAVHLALGSGAVRVLRQDGDRSMERTVAAVEAVRAIARRPDEIRQELDATIAALSGRRLSSPWTWSGGIAATVPCGRSLASLAVALDGQRPIVRLVVDAALDLAEAELVDQVDGRDGDAWQPLAISGMVARGDVVHFRDAAAIAAFAPTGIVIQKASAPRLREATTRCEIRWRSWIPRLPALQGAMQWIAATFSDVTQSSPYR